MQSIDETEQHTDSIYIKMKPRPQEIKFPTCIGKANGNTCKNCLYRSYCDGIPEVI